MLCTQTHLICLFEEGNIDETSYVWHRVVCVVPNVRNEKRSHSVWQWKVRKLKKCTHTLTKKSYFKIRVDWWMCEIVLEWGCRQRFYCFRFIYWVLVWFGSVSPIIWKLNLWERNVDLHFSSFSIYAISNIHTLPFTRIKIDNFTNKSIVWMLFPFRRRRVAKFKFFVPFIYKSNNSQKIFPSASS